MGWIRKWRKRIRALTRRTALERELDEEMAFHLEMEIRKNLESGMSPKEARRQAAISFGGVERYKLQTREARFVRPVENLLQDLHFGLRSLRKRPVFSIVALTTLALGIGGATTIYTIADSVLLSGSPYPDPGRLVSVWGTRPDWRGQDTRDSRWNRDQLSYREYWSWRDGSSLFEDVALFKAEELVGRGEEEGVEERLMVGIATSSLLGTLGIQPSLGRWFLPEEEGNGAPHLAVLGHSYWKRRFGSDPGVIGSSVLLRDDEDLVGESFTVIGVVPEGFSLRRTNAWEFSPGFNLWRPADVPEKDIWLPVGWDYVRSWPSYEGIGRMRPEVSIAQAQSEIEPLIRGDASPEERGVRVQSYSGLLTAGLRTQVVVLALPAALLLLIAFINLAGLFFGEVGGRKHELATRMALGAGKSRIVAQLLAEAALLGLVGSTLGALLSIAATSALVGMAPSASPLREAEAFWPALHFASLIGIVGTLLFALAPAAFTRLASEDLSQRSAGRNASPAGQGIQRRLVTLQVGFTAIVLVQAGLLGRTLLNLSQVELGFGQEDLAVIRFSLPDAYPKPEYVPLFDEVLERVGAVPGVREVSLINALPLTERGGTEDDYLVLPTGPPDPPQVAQRRTVSPGYHEMMKIPLVQGRLLSLSDGSGDTNVAVVSEFMAGTVWPDRSPLGESFEHMGRQYRVVGVVGDVHHGGPAEGYVTMFYTTYAQNPKNQSFLVAHVPTGPGAALPAIDGAIKSIPVPVMTHLGTTMDELVARRVTDQRYHAALALGFGIIAVMLAAAGVLGIAARAVTRRRHEIAVRKALGAREGGLVWDIVASGTWQALVGTVLGLTLALVGARVLSGYLFGVSAVDPITYGVGGLLLLLVCAAASLIPARRIAAIDPMNVLKAE
ncbi:ADOP family duplicated permease [Gemmatimonadota bacterium]